MSIYLNIKEILDSKKILQKDLAIALSVNKNTVINWFKNEKGIRAEQVPGIAKVLRVNISELYGEDSGKIATEEVVVQKVNEGDKAVIALLKEQLKEERDENKRLSIEVDRLKTKKASSPSVVGK